MGHKYIYLNRSNVSLLALSASLIELGLLANSISLPVNPKSIVYSRFIMCFLYSEDRCSFISSGKAKYNLCRLCPVGTFFGVVPDKILFSPSYVASARFIADAVRITILSLVMFDKFPFLLASYTVSNPGRAAHKKPVAA